jgi:hypothetical protein
MKYTLLSILILLCVGCKTDPEKVVNYEIRVNFTDGGSVLATNVFEYDGYVRVYYADGSKSSFPWRSISSIDYGK